VKFIPMCRNHHEGVNSSSVENCTLLSYAASYSNFLLMSWDNQSVPRSSVVYFAAVVHTYQVPVSIRLLAFGSVPVTHC